MMTEVSPFHEPLPSAAVAVNLLIRHPRIKSLQGVCLSHYINIAMGKVCQSCGKPFYLQDSTELWE